MMRAPEDSPGASSPRPKVDSGTLEFRLVSFYTGSKRLCKEFGTAEAWVGRVVVFHVGLVAFSVTSYEITDLWCYEMTGEEVP